MQERKIDFSHDDNKEPVEIEKDNLNRKVDQLTFTLSHLKELRKKDKLGKGFCATICSNIESYTRDLLGALDYDSNLEQEAQERVKKIKEVNIENRELRKQLGEKVSPEDVRECLKNIDKAIRKWWREEGTGHVSATEFHEYYIKVKLSGMIPGILRGEDPIEGIRKRGYDIISEGRADGWLSAGDKNTTLIQRKLKQRFPSAVMREVKCYYHPSGTNKISSITFDIKDYDDVSVVTSGKLGVIGSGSDPEKHS